MNHRPSGLILIISKQKKLTLYSNSNTRVRSWFHTRYALYNHQPRPILYSKSCKRNQAAPFQPSSQRQN